MIGSNDAHLHRLLFIGAGASFGARDRIVDPPPPLGAKLIDYLEDCLPTFKASNARSRRRRDEGERLEVFFADQRCGGIHDYEPAINQLLKREKDAHGVQSLLLALNRLLAFSFSHSPRRNHPAFQPTRDRYDQLVELLGIDESWRVITLNYDTLFEAALERHGLKFAYPGLSMGAHPLIGSSADAVLVYKPHGSINWFAPSMTQCDYSRSDSGPPQIDSPSDAEHVYDGDIIESDLVAINAHHTCDFRTSEVHQRLFGFRSYDPVMAQFCAQKPALLNYRAPVHIRVECAKTLTGVERAVVVGVRPVAVDDDATVDEIFRQLPRSCTEYVNPGNEDADEIERRYGLTAKRMTLEKWLNQIAEESHARTSQ